MDKTKYFATIAQHSHEQGISLKASWRQLDGGEVYASYNSFKTCRHRHNKRQRQQGQTKRQPARNTGLLIRLSDMY